jgi:tetratricopeptide (TPR) repeat protein
MDKYNLSIIISVIFIILGISGGVISADTTVDTGRENAFNYQKLIEEIDYADLLEKELDLMEKLELKIEQPFLYQQLGELRLKIAAYNYSRFRCDSSDNKALFKALEYSASAAELLRDYDQSWLIFGLVLSEFKSEKEMLEKAGQAFIKAAELNPANAQAQQLLAQNMLEQGRFWSAVEQYKNLFNKDRSMLTGTNISNLTLAYIADGRMEAGLNYLGELQKKAPNNFYINTSMAVLYKNLGYRDVSQLIIETLLLNQDRLTANQKLYLENLLAKWEGAGE